MKAVGIFFLIIFSVGIIATGIVKQVQLTQNCTGYLKRAADAGNVETAKAQLSKAIHYLEENDMTHGYTSIFYKTPDEDVEFWYKNLKSSEAELMKVDSSTSALEKTNLLMKLRETLLDNGSDGTDLTYPDGLAMYPQNGLWAFLITFSILALLALALWWLVEAQ